jgi:acyl dehydratase
MFSMALMGRLITSFAPSFRVTAFSARFIGVTWVGDEITATARVAALDRDALSVRLDLSCLNQDVQTPLTDRAALSFAPNRHDNTWSD